MHEVMEVGLPAPDGRGLDGMSRVEMLELLELSISLCSLDGGDGALDEHWTGTGRALEMPCQYAPSILKVPSFLLPDYSSSLARFVLVLLHYQQNSPAITPVLIRHLPPECNLLVAFPSLALN